MAAKTSSPASAFIKVLRSFETGGFTCRDVVAEVQRLLKAGASPTEMSEILRRREFIEPLPVDAHREVLGLLDEAIERAAAEAVDQQVESAAKATIRLAPPPPAPPARTSDPIPTPASKLTATTVQTPNERATQTPTPTQPSPPAVTRKWGTSPPPPDAPPKRSSAAEATSSSGPTRAPPANFEPPAEATTPTSAPTQIHEATRPATPTSVSAPLPTPPPAPPPAWESVQGKTVRITPPAPSPEATTRRIAEAVTPVIVPPKSDFLAVTTPVAAARPAQERAAAPTPKPAPSSAAIPPAGKPVTAVKPARVEVRELDDWSDIAISREELSQSRVAKGNASKDRGVLRPDSRTRVIGLSAAVLTLAAISWFYAHHESVSTQAPAVPPAAVPNPGALIRDCPTCAAMTVLPAARFKQGFTATDTGSLSYEKPPHWVTIGHPFAMSANLVTVDEFRQFIDATGRAMQGCDTYDGAWKHQPENNWQNPGFAQTGMHPVTCVSWSDAAAYARWLSTKTGHPYRLPSASEWEYAARAGGEAVYPWASNGSNACAYANVADASAAHRYPGWQAFACDDGYVNTSPVGSFKANSLGLKDLLGNVFQWTQDCWHADYRGAPVDGSARTDGDCSERELRGGSWFTPPSYVRANYRNHFASDYRTSSVGIRLVRDIGA